MKYLSIIVIIAVLLLGGMQVDADAQEPAKGEITGQVVNGTKGGGSVAGVIITLVTYVDKMMSATTTTITDGEGKFRFDDVAKEHTYLVSAKYMGVDYFYPVTFESGKTTAYVDVWVCDVTNSDRGIRVDIAHTVINVAEDSLKITEVYWLVNDGDMTYVGTDGVLVFTLPEGAFGFEAPQELMIDYQLLERNRIVYLVPFPPGERQLIYSYHLAKPGTAEFTIPKKIDYATESFELMVGGENVEVAVSQLTPAEPVVADTGKRFIHFQGKKIPRDTVIYLHISNLSEGDIPIWLIPGAIVAVVAVAGMIVYLIRRKKRVEVRS